MQLIHEFRHQFKPFRKLFQAQKVEIVSRSLRFLTIFALQVDNHAIDLSIIFFTAFWMLYFQKNGSNNTSSGIESYDYRIKDDSR